MDVKLCCLLVVFSFASLTRSDDRREKILENFSRASNNFGVNLFRTQTLALGGNKNAFFSPLSIYTAFAMINAGARGRTSYQLQRVLNWNTFAKPGDALNGHDKIKIFIKTLFGLESKSPIQFANKLWLQRYFTTSASKQYVKLLKEKYYTELGVENFAKAPEKARKEINKWVAEKTANKITELLESGTVRATTRFVLTNAIYFKRDWKYKFDKKSTAAAPFYVSKDKTVQADMMKMTSAVSYASDDDFHAIELPYTTEEVSMILVLPHDRHATKKLESAFNDGLLRKFIRDFRKVKCDVTIPKFKIKSDMHLKDYLSVMGVRDLFDPFQADLSGMLGYKGMFITHAIHQGYLDVNEEGTEAAAATGIVANFRSLIPPTWDFTADHPFIFSIIHKPTATVMFQGEIADPTQELATSHI
eukprot:gene11146-12318_t